ncbi:MAG: hypothetical protein M3021_07295 [Actinomycetota bacterium]|nr:hypothetical protein [Actinomycetota bacterium]
MSQDLFSIARLPEDDLADAELGVGQAAGEPPVRPQALEIIGSVLGSCPEADSEAAVRLRIHVARHPDEPERALLEHLMETGRINRASHSFN